MGTANYAASGIELGWNATVGDDEVALHMGFNEWGWNARASSDDYLGVEFAQPTVDRPISDGQVRAFVWFYQQARFRWSSLANNFPTHADLDGTAGYGGYHDGKTDVFPRGDPRTDELVARINKRLEEVS